jgi:predicted DNA-binding transcriptional regulator AlpA
MLNTTPPRFPEPLMSLERVAATVGVCKRTILRWQKAGDFPHGLKAGRYWRWSQRSVCEWVQSRKGVRS